MLLNYKQHISSPVLCYYGKYSQQNWHHGFEVPLRKFRVFVF